MHDVSICKTRETREGCMAPAYCWKWGEWDSKSTNEKGPSLLVCWACRAGARDFCSDLAALFGPVQIFFPHHTLFKFLIFSFVTHCVCSMYAYILSAHSERILCTSHNPEFALFSMPSKYFHYVLRTRRKKVSLSTMPGDFKGTVFKKLNGG
jgi:hypothetical protein